MSSVNGCHDHPPYPQVYFATGGREPIRHVMSRDCQYTKSHLGQIDPKCVGCKHRIEQPAEEKTQ